jgi:hypothetical protein
MGYVPATPKISDIAAYDGNLVSLKQFLERVEGEF